MPPFTCEAFMKVLDPEWRLTKFEGCWCVYCNNATKHRAMGLCGIVRFDCQPAKGTALRCDQCGAEYDSNTGNLIKEGNLK